MTSSTEDKSCRECGVVVDEDDGRLVIIGENSEGFEWIFLCLSCVREWRRRGLERHGLSSQDIAKQLDAEYPNI
jgi:hypothetical protein